MFKHPEKFSLYRFDASLNARNTQQVSRREIDHFETGAFYGRLYQDVVYWALSLGDPAPLVPGLLNPEVTLEYFHHLYPDKKIIPNNFGLESIENVSVPDGLVFNQDGVTIADVYEYTLRRPLDVFNKKVNAFYRHIDNFPGLFNTAGLVFCVPRDTDTKSILGLSDRIDVIELPFSRVQLTTYGKKFIDQFSLNQPGSNQHP
jgi:hypothetical protein